jgi:hypothetical protein
MKGNSTMDILSDSVIETGLSDLPALEPSSDLLPNVLYRTGISDSALGATSVVSSVRRRSWPCRSSGC